MLNQYEAMIAMDVVAPDDIPVAFEGDLVNACIRAWPNVSRYRWPW